MSLSAQRQIELARLVNIAALFALIGVLAGSLHLQLGVGEQPCPLCLIQRSGMIGLAVGPMMNLLWGIRARHYALSILAAAVGAAGSVRQIFLHIADATNPGYGPEFLGLHLYTWAFVTFAVGIVGCAILLLWETPLTSGDLGLRGTPGVMRIAAYTAIVWVILDAVLIAVSVIPECGLGMCPDDPANISGLGDAAGWVLIAGMGLLSLAAAVLLDRRRPSPA
ncbi:MAG: disulfide bond formation protein B [Actinomycetota bacterium]|nr:disulfide bond formation protein B [Actinomycetota bacterium]MDP2287532.1 disulfide bond formation protein B [Actinomycetota bacterium]